MGLERYNAGGGGGGGGGYSGTRRGVVNVVVIVCSQHRLIRFTLYFVVNYSLFLGQLP